LNDRQTNCESAFYKKNKIVCLVIKRKKKEHMSRLPPKKMSDVEYQADHIRRWLKDSRYDEYTIECVDFLNVDDEGRKSYSIHVIARDKGQETVGVLAFKIKYPYLRVYPCHVKPSASGHGLTCQMYMVPMAFAAEDEKIKLIVAKQVDSTLVNKFRFPRDGELDISDPRGRNGLLTTMERLFEICSNGKRAFKSRLARAEVMTVTDDPELDWSDVAPNFVRVGPGKAAQAGPFNRPLDDPKLWESVKNAKGNWRTVFFDKTPIPEVVLPQAVASVVDRVAGQGGPIMVHRQAVPQVRPHLEMHGYTQTTQCDANGCRRVNHVCKNNLCRDEIVTFELPKLTLE
jgi:diadenosine tetraphosphate (Ap4A) HIT family hydrolase